MGAKVEPDIDEVADHWLTSRDTDPSIGPRPFAQTASHSPTRRVFGAVPVQKLTHTRDMRWLTKPRE